MRNATPTMQPPAPQPSRSGTRLVGHGRPRNSTSTGSRRRTRRSGRPAVRRTMDRPTSIPCRRSSPQTSHLHPRPAPAPALLNDAKGPKPAPEFVEWLMGLPARWVTNPAHQLTQNQQITALGNGVDEYNHHRRHSPGNDRARAFGTSIVASVVLIVLSGIRRAVADTGCGGRRDRQHRAPAPT